MQLQEELSTLPAPADPSAVYLRFIWEPAFIPIQCVHLLPSVPNEAGHR